MKDSESGVQTASTPRRAGLNAEDIQRRLERLDQTGRVRKAQRGRIRLMYDVLAAIADGSVQDPAMAAAAVLRGTDRDVLLRRLSARSARKARGTEENLQAAP